MVAPYAGAWIETLMVVNLKLTKRVAPYAGAWIETQVKTGSGYRKMVAPYAGAWIETRRQPQFGRYGARRSLRGSVD